MSNSYSIKLVNKSDTTQRYGIFARSPRVSGQVRGSVWSNIWKTENLSEDDEFTVNIGKQWYGFNGTSTGSLDNGVNINAAQFQNVTLGGENGPGTSLSYVVNDGMPRFDRPGQPGGIRNAFEIRTGNFRQDEANRGKSAHFRDMLPSKEQTRIIEGQANLDPGNWVIGLGGAADGHDQDPLATFIPAPNERYQIEPTNTYYITVGSFRKGQIINVERAGKNIAIDFTQYESPVNVEHTSNGDLVIVSKKK